MKPYTLTCATLHQCSPENSYRKSEIHPASTPNHPHEPELLATLPSDVHELSDDDALYGRSGVRRLQGSAGVGRRLFWCLLRRRIRMSHP